MEKARRAHLPLRSRGVPVPAETRTLVSAPPPPHPGAPGLLTASFLCPFQKRRPRRRRLRWRRKVKRGLRWLEPDAGTAWGARHCPGVEAGVGAPDRLAFRSFNSLSTLFPLSPPAPRRGRSPLSRTSPQIRASPQNPPQPPKSRSRRQSEVTAAASLPENDFGASPPGYPRHPDLLGDSLQLPNSYSWPGL